jgi:hypothetical protein
VARYAISMTLQGSKPHAANTLGAGSKFGDLGFHAEAPGFVSTKPRVSHPVASRA